MVGRTIGYYKIVEKLGKGAARKATGRTIGPVLQRSRWTRFSESLKPEQVVMLAVGATDAVKAGNPDEPDYSFQSLDDNGEIEMIPLPDPLTMEYPKAPAGEA
jgi:hypothetical protein